MFTCTQMYICDICNIHVRIHAYNIHVHMYITLVSISTKYTF